MSKLNYYLFCIKWLWQNRDWSNTSQKFRALEKTWEKHNKEVTK